MNQHNPPQIEPCNIENDQQFAYQAIYRLINIFQSQIFPLIQKQNIKEEVDKLFKELICMNKEMNYLANQTNSKNLQINNLKQHLHETQEKFHQLRKVNANQIKRLGAQLAGFSRQKEIIEQNALNKNINHQIQQKKYKNKIQELNKQIQNLNKKMKDFQQEQIKKKLIDQTQKKKFQQNRSITITPKKKRMNDQSPEKQNEWTKTISTRTQEKINQKKQTKNGTQYTQKTIKTVKQQKIYRK